MFARRAVLMAALLLALSVSAQQPPPAAAAQTFTFNDPGSRDTVALMLDAPLEVINGLSNALKGTVVVQGTKATGRLTVPVNTLKTGNETRDGHLQNDRWLDAAKHPDIIFEFKDIALPAALEPGKPLKLQTKGKFTIRGVTREEPVEVTAMLFKESAETKNRATGDLLRLRAKFRIPLEAYGIKRTEALLLKVGEVAEVTVDAWGSTQFKL
ncbi:YceI family protein [Hyalangium rubrum]|uniref:YceI family protein n=1 Tax=Hyalangium rubrum TaxID=3103134 RepID=A0ABU5H8E4_9BACT|nr:YceI family protein [Hyalangium sp. s54d21]MDY7229742.1 YceI family protein [Hyalangium sp. s54d21]